MGFGNLTSLIQNPMICNTQFMSYLCQVRTLYFQLNYTSSPVVSLCQSWAIFITQVIHNSLVRKQLL